jgi:ribonuclease P/MRP protein subunit POP5
VRRRYLALQIDSEESLESSSVSDAVWDALLRLFGEVGASQAWLYVVRFDKEKKHMVLRCSHKALPMVRASVATITSIDGKRAAVHVIRVSGTLKALGRKMAA